MLPVNVAVVDVDKKKRAEIEQFLQQDKQCIAVLTDVVTNQNESVRDRRFRSRKDITEIVDNIERIKRLKPRVLLVGGQQISERGNTFLVKLRCECPDVLVILLVDESVGENSIINALANGVRGILNYSTGFIGFSKAVRAVERGEAWVSRKIYKNIMKIIQDSFDEFSAGARFDIAG